MTLWRVSINSEDWIEVEAISAAHAASDVCLTYMESSGERRGIDLLIVRKAERTPLAGDPRDDPDGALVDFDG